MSRRVNPRDNTAHLRRMLATKEARLGNFKGTAEAANWLRGDIAALRFAIALAEGCEREGITLDVLAR